MAQAPPSRVLRVIFGLLAALQLATLIWSPPADRLDLAQTLSLTAGFAMLAAGFAHAPSRSPRWVALTAMLLLTIALVLTEFIRDAAA